MSCDLFQTEAWFGNLLAHGFECPPQHHRWPLAPGGAQLHLMQTVDEPHTLRALSNYYSALYGPSGDVAGLSAVQWADAGRALRRHGAGAVLRLQPLDADSAWLAALETGLNTAGYRCDRFFCFGNWHQPVPPGGFERYWQERPSALRHSIERGQRRLDKAGSWRIDILSGHPGENWRQGLAAYQSVYARSWKQPEPCAGFMPGLVETAAREGWLRLGVLWLGQEPLAAQVWLVQGGKANIYKLAYVEGQQRLSVGSVLTAALMRHAMEVDRVAEVDYLSGDDAYKADWMALRRERVGLVAFDWRRSAGALAAFRHGLGRLRARLGGA